MRKACIDAHELGCNWVGAILSSLRTSAIKASKGRDTWRSAKRQLYMKNKGGSVDDRSLYTLSSREQGPNANKDSSAEAFKTGTSFKNSATEVSV